MLKTTLLLCYLFSSCSFTEATQKHHRSFADIHDSSGASRNVWSLDGNVRGTSGHTVLVAVALLFLILFLLPFTLSLLLVPFLRAEFPLQPLLILDQHSEAIL